ncbi:DUF2625 family protein [Actinoplanes campanulatus]|nr:DUF2625 family protein [Actinoplanes capillaceus]
MRALTDLIDTEDSAWPEILNAVAGAPCPVTVLPADQGRADAELERVRVMTRSWLGAMLGGATAQFYANLRWDGWAEEVAACGLDQAISLFPPPWTVEGKDLNTVSRHPVPMAEALS